MSAVVVPARAFERLVDPRRNNALARPKPIDVAATLAAARGRWKSMRVHWTNGWSVRKDARVEMERAADAMMEEGTLPGMFDLEILAAAERMLHGAESILSAIVAQYGPRAALEVKMRSYAWNVASGRQEKTWWWMLADAAATTHRQVDSGWQALRSAFCAVDEASYAEARELGERLRLEELDVARRVAFDFAFPAETAWSSEDMRALLARPDITKITYMVVPLLASLTDEDAYVQFVRQCLPRQTQPIMSYACDVVAAFEPEAATRILSVVARVTIGAKHFDTKEMQKIACALSSIRSEAMARELATWLRHARFGRHVVWYFEKYDDLARVALASAAQEKSMAADAARAILDANARAREADDGTLDAAPPILVSPPWRRRPTHAPITLEPLPFSETISWENGEREKLAATPAVHATNNAQVRPITGAELVEFNALAESQKYVDVWPRWQSKQWTIAELPDDVRRALWGRGIARLYSRPPCFMLARYGEDALEGLFKRDVFDAYDDRLFVACLRVDSPRTALVCARALGRRRNWKERAKAWLLAHAEAASIGLIPAALGAAGRPRRLAERAIRYLAAHRADVLREVAARYGEAARVAIEDFAFGDPLARIDVRVHPPRWLDVARLPEVRSRDGRPIAYAAVRNLLDVLAARGDDVPYPGIEVVRDALDPSALAELAWALFATWALHGRKRMHEWMALAMGAFTTDELVSRITPIAREWTQANPRACLTLVDALAAMGSGPAMLELRAIADAARAPMLVEAAQRALGPESARMVDLGLDARGEARIDLGSRSVRVVLDESLVPLVVLPDGRRVPQMPRAAKNDDPERVLAATTFFKRLRHASRTIARTDLRRLERAMIAGRRFTVEELERRWLSHPLLAQAARRVVWGVHDGPSLAATFRVVEDGTYADCDDMAFTLDRDALVSIVHPIDLDAHTVARWGTLFADYEILQPFEQLGRSTFAGTLGQAVGILKNVRGGGVEARALLKTLDVHGWDRPAGRRVASATRAFRGPKGAAIATFSFSPGIQLDAVRTAPPQTLGEMKVPSLPTLEGMPRVDVSELVRTALALRA